MTTIQYQNQNYLNDNITNVFHFLSINGQHSHLIGSGNIRNFLYSNDYDLNENFNVHDNKQVFQHLYQEFLHIFHQCYHDDDFYILDFKCGEDDKNEPLRWTYNDMKKGYQIVNNKKYLFTDCLKQDAIIKIDVIYILNGEFEDITNNYFIHILNKKDDYEQSKEKKVKDITEKLDNDIDELIKEKEYFKALKRYFSILKIDGKTDKQLLDLLNSDYGRFYKVIHDLQTIVLLLEQKFKPIDINLIKDNLQIIKEFTSHIVDFDVTHVLDKINDISKLNSESSMKKQIELLIKYSKEYLNRLVEKFIKKFIG